MMYPIFKYPVNFMDTVEFNKRLIKEAMNDDLYKPDTPSEEPQGDTL